MCIKCKSVESHWLDEKPGFEESTGKYIAKARCSCPTEGCCPVSSMSGPRLQKKRQTFIPVDTTIAYIRANNLSDKSRNKSIKPKVSGLILTDGAAAGTGQSRLGFPSKEGPMKREEGARHEAPKRMGLAALQQSPIKKQRSVATKGEVDEKQTSLFKFFGRC